MYAVRVSYVVHAYMISEDYEGCREYSGLVYASMGKLVVV